MNAFLYRVFKGLLTILPVFLTLYLIVWLGLSIENFAKPYLDSPLYFPGLGILVSLLVLSIIGILVNAYLIESLINKIKTYIEKLPLIKTLYGAISDAVELFKVSKQENQKRAVLVELAKDVFVVGFITGEQATNLMFPEGEKVAVYIPLSYQIGGYTIYISPNQTKPLNIDVETAMRIAVTGGNSIKSKVEDLNDSSRKHN
ncbi:DUF502 domain-containing protein [Glaciecola sp. 1036]|uniref:DUF502 domain-containing protein n=1 Tax=Alteromonadaceae TaxID=72275 RepID=UPI003CFCCA97